MNSDLVTYAVKAKQEMDKLNTLLKPKIKLDDDSFYESLIPLYEDSENTNPNINRDPDSYELHFTNGRHFTLNVNRYYKVQQIINTLKYYTEKIDQLKIKKSDKDFVKSHTSMYEKSSAPAAGGNAKTKKKRGIKRKGRKTRIGIRKRTTTNK